MKKIIFILLAGSMCVFNSCTKTGPQGPQGNANVIGTDKTITINSWTLSNSIYSASIQDNDITADIVNSGIVEVYKSYANNEWSNLPDINGITSTVFNFYVGGYTIYIQNSDGSTPANPGSITFRDVVVAPSERLAHPNTNWANYNDAMAALNSTSAAAPSVSH